MPRLLASAHTLASDGSRASMADPLHEAEKDQAATTRNVLVAKVKLKKLSFLLCKDFLPPRARSPQVVAHFDG
jgi:hypothetical protein